MLYFDIHRMFKLRGISKPRKFLAENGFSLSQAQRICQLSVWAMRLKVLDRLCLALKCTPNDLIIWKPSKPEHDIKDHPLQKLKAVDVLDLTSITSDISPEQIPDLVKAISEAKARIMTKND